jgi:hypothetical protein
MPSEVAPAVTAGFETDEARAVLGHAAASEANRRTTTPAAIVLLNRFLVERGIGRGSAVQRSVGWA